jgi:hypothetical protein
MVQGILDKRLTDPTNPHISAHLLEFLCENIQGSSFVSKPHWRQAEGSAVLILENDQEKLAPLKPEGMILMSPDKKIGEGQFRALGGIFVKITIEDLFVLNAYFFEVMMGHHTPGRIVDCLSREMLRQQPISLGTIHDGRLPVP